MYNSKTHLDEISDHFKFAVSVDCVVLGYQEGELNLLTNPSNIGPFKGMDALLGDLVFVNENLDQAASRILINKTGLSAPKIKQFKTFSDINRHPLGRVISTGYYILLSKDIINQVYIKKEHLTWKPITEVKQMAFDHIHIFENCLDVIKTQFIEFRLWRDVLSKEFTLTQLQVLLETITQEPIDKRNFRKKILGADLIESTGRKQKDVPHRPASLYRTKD